MPRTRSIAWAELRVGITAAVALILLVGLVFAVGGDTGFWWQRYELKARFTAVQGLKPGAVVRLNGKEIGSVKSVEFAGPQIEVGLEVSNDVKPLLTTDAVAEIGALSLLGEPIVDITAASTGQPLANGAYLKVREAGSSISDLTATASTSLGQVNELIADIRGGRGTLGKLVTDDALYTELQAFVSSAAAVTKAVDAGQGTIGGLVKDPAAYAALKSSLQNLQQVTDRINRGEGALGKLVNDDAVGRSIANTTSHMDQITDRLAMGEGTAGKLLTDQQLYDRLNGMIDRVDQLVAGLDAGKGTAGQLLHDQQLYENMNRAATELRDLLAAIRKDPRKYLRVTVSIF
jgi:phospholipid/cholesterol/gamma-HCH transport system substrate-binding protein